VVTQKGQVAEPRGRLSKERVLQAAVALADRDGIEALSMRKLAEELGVEAMSLYYYVANKDDILAGMLELVMEEIETPSGGPGTQGWKEAIRTGAISFHDVLRKHTWARTLMLSPKTLRPWRMRFMEWLLERLQKGGFSADLTYHAYHALDSHLIGSTAWEAGYASFAKNSKMADLAKSFLDEMPLDQLPYVGEHVRQHVEGFGKGKSQFQFGLDLILDGLERMRDAELGRGRGGATVVG
jgi:AcrR family transcriptional regulator